MCNYLLLLLFNKNVYSLLVSLLISTVQFWRKLLQYSIILDHIWLTIFHRYGFLHLYPSKGAFQHSIISDHMVIPFLTGTVFLIKSFIISFPVTSFILDLRVSVSLAVATIGVVSTAMHVCIWYEASMTSLTGNNNWTVTYVNCYYLSRNFECQIARKTSLSSFPHSQRLLIFDIREACGSSISVCVCYLFRFFFSVCTMLLYVFTFAPPRGRQSLYLLEGVRYLCLHCLAHFRAV